MLQWCWQPIDEGQAPAVEDVLERAARDPAALSPLEASLLQSHLADGDALLAFRWAEFPAPFDKYFAYLRVLNVAHPAAVALVRVMAAVLLASSRRTVPPEALGKVRDAFREAMRMRGSALAAPGKWSGALEALWSAARQHGLLDSTAGHHLVPGPDEFVPGIGRSAALEQGWAKADVVQPFGEALV